MPLTVNKKRKTPSRNIIANLINVWIPIIVLKILIYGRKNKGIV